MVSNAPRPPEKPSGDEDNLKTPTERGFASGYTAGLNLLSSVLVGFFMGLGLDVLFGTKPLFILIFLVLGAVAGFRGIWAYMNALNSDDKN